MEEYATIEFPQYGFKITAPSHRVLDEIKNLLAELFQIADGARQKFPKLVESAKAGLGQLENFDLKKLPEWERMLKAALRRAVEDLLKDREDIEVHFYET
ncbi:MAG: hypothetical protein ABIH35_02780 [Patescibacteria group bacterium]